MRLSVLAAERRGRRVSSTCTTPRVSSASAAHHEVNGTGAHAILVLAGGQTHCGGVPQWVDERLAQAAKAFHKQRASGAAPPALVVLGGGSPHAAPVMNAHGRVLHESASCASILMREHGVAASAIYKETSSYDTIGNAFFALVSHCLPRQWTRLVVVTSAFHLPRTRVIFEWVFGVCGAGGPYELEWIGTSDDGLEQIAATARAGRERASLEDVREKAARIRTLAELHEFINQVRCRVDRAT